MSDIPNDWPMWMQTTELAWRLMWRILGVMAVSAAIPAGILIGLRLIRLIKPVVNQ